MINQLEESKRIQKAEVYYAVEEAMENGIDIGMQKGIEQGMRESAKRMKAKGSSFDYISEITGLSIDEIEAL